MLLCAVPCTELDQSTGGKKDPGPHTLYMPQHLLEVGQQEISLICNRQGKNVEILRYLYLNLVLRHEDISNPLHSHPVLIL